MAAFKLIIRFVLVVLISTVDPISENTTKFTLINRDGMVTSGGAKELKALIRTKSFEIARVPEYGDRFGEEFARIANLTKIMKKSKMAKQEATNSIVNELYDAVQRMFAIAGMKLEIYDRYHDGDLEFW